MAEPQSTLEGSVIITGNLEILGDVSNPTLDSVTTKLQTIEGTLQVVQGEFETKLLALADDGLITPAEKTTIRDVWLTIQTEYPIIHDKAVAKPIAAASVSSYETAYAQLQLYLFTEPAVLADMSATTEVDRVAYNSATQTYTAWKEQVMKEIDDQNVALYAPDNNVTDVNFTHTKNADGSIHVKAEWSYAQTDGDRPADGAFIYFRPDITTPPAFNYAIDPAAFKPMDGTGSYAWEGDFPARTAGEDGIVIHYRFGVVSSWMGQLHADGAVSETTPEDWTDITFDSALQFDAENYWNLSTGEFRCGNSVNFIHITPATGEIEVTGMDIDLNASKLKTYKGTGAIRESMSIKGAAITWAEDPENGTETLCDRIERRGVQGVCIRRAASSGVEKSTDTEWTPDIGAYPSHYLVDNNGGYAFAGVSSGIAFYSNPTGEVGGWGYVSQVGNSANTRPPCLTRRKNGNLLCTFLIQNIPLSTFSLWESTSDDEGATWSSQTEITLDHNPDYHVLKEMADGSQYLVYIEANTGTLYGKRRIGTSWGGEEEIAPGTYGREFSIELVIEKDGELRLFLGASDGIKQVRTNNLVWDSSPTTVTTDVTGTFLRAVATSGGEFLCAYADNTSKEPKIVFTQDGTWQTSTTLSGGARAAASGVYNIVQTLGGDIYIVESYDLSGDSRWIVTSTEAYAPILGSDTDNTLGGSTPSDALLPTQKAIADFIERETRFRRLFAYYNTAGAKSITVPDGVDEVFIFIAGAGGGGGLRGTYADGEAGGAAGGAAILQKKSVTPGETISFTLGTGGASEVSGTASTIDGISCAGGGRGYNGTPGTGGAVTGTSENWDILSSSSGGNGGNESTSAGGGGGAIWANNGNAASGATPGAAKSYNTPIDYDTVWRSVASTGGKGGAASGNGSPGSYGGGGGGCGSTTTVGAVGGSGAAGFAIVCFNIARTGIRPYNLISRLAYDLVNNDVYMINPSATLS